MFQFVTYMDGVLTQFANVGVMSFYHGFIIYLLSLFARGKKFRLIVRIKIWILVIAYYIHGNNTIKSSTVLDQSKTYQSVRNKRQ